jgi:TonB family protein
MAAVAPLPVYPEASVRAGREGKVVVAITVDRDGAVEAASVLEASEAAMKTAVLNTVKQWRFSPIIGADRKPMRVVGRLVFYFAIRQGKPVVIDAAAAAFAAVTEKYVLIRVGNCLSTK